MGLLDFSTAPTNGTKVILYNENWERKYVIAYWDSEWNGWRTDTGIALTFTGISQEPTHWSPLPTLPKEEDEEREVLQTFVATKDIYAYEVDDLLDYFRDGEDNFYDRKTIDEHLFERLSSWSENKTPYFKRGQKFFQYTDDPDTLYPEGEEEFNYLCIETLQNFIES